MYSKTLSKFLSNSGLVRASYFDGVKCSPIYRYFTQEYFRLLLVLNSDSKDKAKFQTVFLEMLNSICDLQDKYRHSVLLDIALRHKEVITKLGVNFSDQLLRLLVNGFESINSNVLSFETGSFEEEYRNSCHLVYDTSIVDKMLDNRISKIAFNNKSTRFVHEPFKNISISFDEYGRSAKISFEYQETEISFYTYGENNDMHDAVGWNEAFSKNYFGGGYLDERTSSGESYIAYVLRYFLIMADKIAKKCNSEEIIKGKCSDGSLDGDTVRLLKENSEKKDKLYS